MISSLAKQGGRRYGQMGLGSCLVLWLRSVGITSAPVFKPIWAWKSNSTVGFTIEPK